MRYIPILLVPAIIFSFGPARATLSDSDLVAAAEFVGSIKVTDAKCEGLTEKPGALDFWLNKNRISKEERQTPIYQKALHSYIDKKQNTKWECIRAYVDNGPGGEDGPFFELATSDAGKDFGDSVQQRKKEAAKNYRLVSNARNVCGLFLDDETLIRSLLEDGIYIPFFRMIHNGTTPTLDQERNPHFIIQQETWRKADLIVRQFKGQRSYCYSMWTDFGPNGTKYSDVLAKPETPFSPYELPDQ